MANVGLFGFLKLDAEGVKKGVNDTKLLLAELQASYATLQKSAMDAISKIEIDPKAARAGLKDLSDNIHDLSKELDEAEKRLSRFFVKVGADPDSMKKTIIETKDALYGLRQDAENLVEVKIKVSHQEMKEVADKIKEDMAGAEGLIDPILNDFRKLGRIKMIDPSLIKEQLSEVSSYIIDVKNNLRSISDISISSDAEQAKKEFLEVNDTLIRLRTTVTALQQQLIAYEKFGINVKPFREELKVVDDSVGKLKSELRATSKIDFAENIEKFHEKVGVAKETFTHLKDTVSVAKTELTKLSKTPIDMSATEKSFMGITDKIVDLDIMMGKVSTKGEKEFIQAAGTISHKFADVGNDLRNILADLGQYHRLGVDTSEIEAKVKALQKLALDLRTKFTDVSNMTVDTDTEALKKGMAEFQDSLANVKDGLDTVSGRTDEVFKHEAKMKRWSAMWRHWSDTLASVSAKFLLIQFALNRMSSMVVSAFRPAFRAIEGFRESIVSMAATITSLQMPEGDEIGEAYVRAKNYAEGLLYTLQKIDENSIATMTDLKVMTDQFVKHGVLLDYMSESAVEAYKNIGNAIAVIAQAYPARATQVAQEARALMQGSTDIRGTLSTMLDKMMGGRLKENLALWKQQGTVIENIGKHLKGFTAASDDVSTLWSSISATMENIRDRILRAGFTPAYKMMINSLKTMNEFLKEHEKTLVGQILTGWELTKTSIHAAASALEPLFPLVKILGKAFYEIVKMLTYTALDILPKLGIAFRTAFFPLTAALKYIDGGFKAVWEHSKEFGKDFMDALNDTALKEFERDLQMVGVRFDPLREGMKGMVVEMDRFSEMLTDVAKQRDWVYGLSQGADTFIKKAGELKRRLEDIGSGKTKFETTEALKQELDFIMIQWNLLYSELESKPEIKFSLDATGFNQQFKDVTDNIKTFREMLQKNMELPEIGGLPTDWESTISEFYSEAKIKSEGWFQHEVRNIEVLKSKWMELTKAINPETGRPFLTKEEVDSEAWKRIAKANAEMLNSKKELVDRLKELDEETTSHLRTELDTQILLNNMWGEKMKSSVQDLATDLDLPLEEIWKRFEVIDSAVIAKNEAAMQDFGKDIEETLADITVSIAKAKEKTGELDFIQATDQSIAALEQLQHHYESLSWSINMATDTKKWLKNQLAIEETKQKIGELKAEIVDFQAKAAVVEIEVKIKGIERKEKMFEISEKQAVQEMVQEYEKLLAVQEKTLDKLAAAGDMEAWTQWNEQIGETREKLLELQETAMQVSDNMQKGLLDGLKRFYNENQSMYQTASDAMYESAGHAAETLSTVMSDFRHGELKEWHEYLGDFAEMVLQTLERLIAQMLIAKALGMALGIGFTGGGTTASNDPFASTDAPLDFHTGGYIGKSYRGGAAGLQHDEIPAVLQTGEGVLSRKEMFQLGGEPGFEKLREMIKTETVFSEREPARTSHMDNAQYYNRINNVGQETNISVPVNIEGGNKKLEVKLRDEIEATVRRVIKEMV